MKWDRSKGTKCESKKKKEKKKKQKQQQQQIDKEGSRWRVVVLFEVLALFEAF